MTHLERVKNSIERKPIDRIPIHFWGTKEFNKDLETYLGKDLDTILYQMFDIDRRYLGPDYTGPEMKKYENGDYDNIFGVRMRDVNYGNGTYSESVWHPLADISDARDVENYAWPSPDWYDYTSIGKWLKESPGYSFTVGYQAIGWFSWEMRGMSLFLEDLLIEPEIAEAVIDKVAGFGTEYYRRLIEGGKEYIGKNFMFIHLADDWATQEGLLISRELYRKYFMKRVRAIADMAHAAGVLVEFHCCGSAYHLIPDFIESGIDMLNPIQTSAKDMDPKRLKDEFGKYISFSGGIDVQTVLPFGTPKQVKEEVYHLLDTMGRGGGYILEPSHAVQVGTPPENVAAMYAAVYEYYGIKNDWLFVL